MLKRISIRKIILSSFTILVLFLLYLIPNNTKDLKVEQIEQYTNLDTSNMHEIYLLDSNNYIARTTISMVNTDKTTEEKARELLEALIIGEKKKVLYQMDLKL